MGKNMHTSALSLCLEPKNTHTFLNLLVRPIQSYPMSMKEHMFNIPSINARYVKYKRNSAIGSTV
jgi:hypothetical protein